MQSQGNYPHGTSSIGDDYPRNNGSGDYDSRGSGPPSKRSRVDVFNEGHWANAPTDRRNASFSSIPSQGSHWRQHTNEIPPSSAAILDETLGETLTAAQQGVSPFFQTASDEELRGFNQTLKSIQK